MVEFGLKLEDNKVDEWSSQYLDYEKLKGELKRAKASAEKRDELLKRMPPAVAAEVDQELKDREAGSSLGLDASYAYDVPIASSDGSYEITPLLRLKRSDSLSSSLSNHLNHGVLKVTSYLGLADNREYFLKKCDDSDDKLGVFLRTYEREVKKVQDFYNEKTDEISQRLEVLVESVDTSGLKPKEHKRRKSMVKTFTSKFEEILQGSGKRGSIQVSNLPDIRDILAQESMDDEDEKANQKKRDEMMRKSDSIKRAITDVYRTSKLLHNYSIMNYTGFVKIAKKFDKTIPTHKGALKGKICDDGKQAELLASKLEKIYAKWFCEGDIREAQAQMLTKRGDGLLMDWTQLRLGYRLGMCSILALWVAWDCIWGQYAKGERSIGGRSAFPVFRGCFGLIAWHWFWGLSVYIWTRFRINYIYLFDFDPRNVDMPIDIFNDAVDEALVFLVCMLMYYKADSGDMPLVIPPRAYPFFLIMYMIKCLLFPWKMRKPLWIAIKQVVSAPFVSPTFFSTYVGDVFTSMVKVFQDLLWSICFVASGDFLLPESDARKYDNSWSQQFWYKNVAIPLICLLPLWFRFNQCLRRYLDTGKRMPNLANAFKYAMSQSVTLFGAFHPLYLMYISDGEVDISLVDDDDNHDGQGQSSSFLERHAMLFQMFWMGLFVASSLYSFCWDVYMDWGLGRREHGFLGTRLMFPKRSYYYTVIGLDLVLRFMWVLTLIPPQSGAQFELPAYLSAVSMTVELFRRTIWSFFRLEHEHRQNTEGFRRVNVVPLHFNTGHKHKYNERQWVGWRVLIEIAVVTSIVIAISAFSVIVAQGATHRLQMSNPKDL